MIDFNNLPAKDKLYYLDAESGIAIYCADCREILPLIPDKSIDLVLTDPPYGINVGNNESSKEKRDGLLVKGKYASYDDTPENYRKIVIPAISKSLNITKRGMVFGFPPMIFELPHPDVMGGIYVPAGCGRNRWGWTSSMPILFYGNAPDLQKGAKPTVFNGTFQTTCDSLGHPTPKPINWILWAMSLGSRSGEFILDPFLGSGTTAVCAKKLGRKCIGIEIEEKYCKIANQRLAQSVMRLE